MRILYVILICLIPVSAAFAYVPLIYSKTLIRIVPAEDSGAAASREPTKNGKDETGKTLGDSKTSDLLPSLHRIAKEFTVEVRPMSFLDQKDFIAHQPFTDREGMMMVIDPPAQEQLKSTTLVGKTDVLFVLDDGTIEKIAPQIDLSQLSEPLATDKPVRAFIFLKAGTAQQADIRPGDHVVGFLFKTHPVILQ